MHHGAGRGSHPRSSGQRPWPRSAWRAGRPQPAPLASVSSADRRRSQGLPRVPALRHRYRAHAPGRCRPAHPGADRGRALQGVEGSLLVLGQTTTPMGAAPAERLLSPLTRPDQIARLDGCSASSRLTSLAPAPEALRPDAGPGGWRPAWPKAPQPPPGPGHRRLPAMTASGPSWLPGATAGRWG